jgi:hypothetical protein
MANPSTSPASAEPAPPAGAPPVAPTFRDWFHRFEDMFFPPLTGPTTNRRGVLSAQLAEWPAVLVALAIGLVVAGLLERTMLSMPIPPGGDPGQWTSTAFAYAGLPFPSWIVPGQYPPLLFPLLGLLVRIGGGPIGGARLYVGVVTVLIGLSMYFFARGVTRRRSTALLAVAVLLLNPTFLQMFFWGFYPNLLGFVFLNLTLAFLVRYIRSRRPLHGIMFWTCAAATILTHSLVGVVLAGAAGIAIFLALTIKAIPRESYRTKAGWVGFGVFATTVGGFYISTSLLKIPHPQYLHSGAFAYVRNGISAIFNLMLQPFVHALKVAPSDSLALLWILAVGIGLYALGLRLFWKRRLTLGTIVAASLGLSPILLAAGGWELSVVTDYGRFSYFLVAPLALAIALTVDRIMTEINLRATRPSAKSPIAPLRPPRWRPGGGRVDAPAATAVLTLVAITVIVVADVVSVRSLPKDEAETTKVGHDQTFLNALQIIQSSGIPGSLLTVPGVAKWSRALLVRDAYFPNLAARYTFDPTHLVDEETAYFVLTSRFVATNDVVAATALGTNLSSGNATFEYQAAYYGTFTPVAAIPVGNISVTVVHGGTISSGGVTTGGTLRLAPEGAASYSLAYGGTGFVLTVTAVALSTSPEVTYTLTTVADPGYQILAVQGNLTGPSAGAARFVRGSGGGAFDLTPGKFGATLATSATISPGSALGKITQFNHPGVPAHAAYAVGSVNGSGHAQFTLTFTFTTPGASNLVTGLPPLITADTAWANWSVRFVLYSSSPTEEGSFANLLPNEIGYLEAEYGARILGTSGLWNVILLPAPGDLPVGPRPAELPSPLASGGET